MEVKQKNDSSKGVFYIEQNGKTVAQMTYIWVGTSKIIIDHTEVDESLKGQGAGKLMVSKAVEFARQAGIKIVPLCPFAKSVFNKTPDYNDVLLK
jgi:predicted GNAT family acetyltransferase